MYMMMLKTVLAMMTLSVISASSAFARLATGYYIPTRSNNKSVCPQRVKTIYQDGELTALRVFYSGDCADDGPFFYYCDEKLICSQGDISYKIRSSTTYSWRNKSYSIWADFQLKPKTH